MPAGGELILKVTHEQVAQDQEFLSAGEYIQIAVVDTGVGMDAVTLRRAVEPFFTTKGLGRGTGLGLSMVHGLAAQSGGHLALSSTPGVGTRAELWLPVATEEELLPTETQATEVIRASRPATILVVDDEELVRVGTAEMLVDLGYSVIHAASGAEALGLLRQKEVELDLIVSDHLMPGISGADLLREAQRLRADLPVLLVTGYTNMIQGPGSELPRLPKPFRQADLATRVAELLDRNEPNVISLNLRRTSGPDGEGR
jgi:CheY-like chemotaxis protein